MRYKSKSQSSSRLFLQFGEADNQIAAAKHLSTSGKYEPEAKLVDAVNVALALRMPLLLTGEPGVGKTRLGHDLANDLGLKPPLSFEMKSSVRSDEVFYSFDGLRFFRDSQNIRGDSKLGMDDYVHFSPLGAAMLLASQGAEESPVVDHAFQRQPNLFEQRDIGSQNIVIIDEIDKAARDIPNDILNEIEYGYFHIKEIDYRVEVKEEASPIVIITSNSERSLPGPFLRRCICFHIEFPSPDLISQIAVNRLGHEFAGPRFLNEAIEFFLSVRENQTFEAFKPGLGDFLCWLLAMRTLGADCSSSLGSVKAHAIATVSALMRDGRSQEEIVELLAQLDET